MNNSPNSFLPSSVKDNWLSYFWYGGAAITLSWALTGCRFGNHEIDPPSTGPFFYETSLTTIKLCATVNSGTPQCATKTNPSYLPNINLTQGATPETGLPDLSQLPDPIELQEATTTTGVNVYGLYDPTSGNPYYPLNYDSQNNLTFPEGQASIPIFIDTTTGDSLCSLNLDLQMNGDLSTAGPFTTNIGVPLTGRMSLIMDANFTPVSQGSGCQTAVSCYSNPASCDGNSQSTVALYYQNFVNAGLINAGNMANVTNLSYEITYQ
jgi:hypothetical protein